MVATGNASALQPESEGCALSEWQRNERRRDGWCDPPAPSLLPMLSVCLLCVRCLTMCVWPVCVGRLSDTMIFCNHLGEYKKDELLEAAR